MARGFTRAAGWDPALSATYRPATLPVEHSFGHLAPGRVAGTKEEHSHLGSSVLCMTTAEAGQAQVNSTEHCTHSGTWSRPMQAKPSRGK